MLSSDYLFLPNDVHELERRITTYLAQSRSGEPLPREQVAEDINIVLDNLEEGSLRIVERRGEDWVVNEWLKGAILLGFEVGRTCEFSIDDKLFFVDKDIFPVRKIRKESSIRILGPSAAIRRGAFVGEGCVLTPPAYVNVGAYVGEGTMVESLAGSCCFIGRGCHISANATIGGVLSPLEAHPVILGDHVLLGEGAGVTQGSRIGDNVAIAPGVHITRSSVVIDCVREIAYCCDGNYAIQDVGGPEFKIYRKGEKLSDKDVRYGPAIPANALVINGQMISAEGHIKVTPMIIKYVDDERRYFDSKHCVIHWS